MGGGTPGHVLFVSRLTFFPKSYLALEKYVAVSRKNRGIGGTGQESRKLINSAPTATGFIFWSRAAICNPSPTPLTSTLELWILNETLFDSIHCNFICKNSGQKKWSRILLPSPYSNQSTWRINICVELEKKIGQRFPILQPYWNIENSHLECANTPPRFKWYKLRPMQ